MVVLPRVPNHKCAGGHHSFTIAPHTLGVELSPSLHRDFIFLGQNSLKEGSMKKANSAKLVTNHTTEKATARCTARKIDGHEHIHSSNCGHKSYVHEDHVCYQHENHFHYMHDGHVHECDGPTPAKVIQLPVKRK